VGGQRIILGSRGSDLALAQARLVEETLREAWPELEIALEIIRTSGDESARPVAVLDRKAGRKGMFTREIERELLSGRIDVAVHSAKDLPSEAVEALEIKATLTRANTEDVLDHQERPGPNGSAERRNHRNREHPAAAPARLETAPTSDRSPARQCPDPAAEVA
jgi:hydroxymethylbilane synthase